MKKFIQNLRDPHTRAQAKAQVELWIRKAVIYYKKVARPIILKYSKKYGKLVSRWSRTTYRYLRRYPYREKFSVVWDALNWANLKFWGPRVTGLVSLVFVFWVLAVLFEVNAPLDKSLLVVEIPPNTPARVVGSILEQRGVVESSFGFRVVTKLFHWESKIHSGEYALSPSMSLWQVMLHIREKKGVSLTQSISTTIPEGYSLKEIAETLEANHILPAQKFLAFANQIQKLESFTARYPFLKDAPSVEGYLFPDTYQFPKDSEPLQVIELMLNRFKEQLKPYDSAIASSGYTMHQIITLASIIEKEAVKPEDRSLIAGVFYNRLKKGIPLGSCPTVKYALGKPRKPYVTFKDIKVVSPYNTYTHYGLPPTPIASPGIASIGAALKPDTTPYLYFVAKGDGTHVFTTSNEEHLKAQKEILNENHGRIY